MDTPARRLTCSRCQRAQRTCICCWITPVEHTVEVVILQHPLEVNHAKGTARLLHLCLPHSRLVTGEVFAEDDLQRLLHAPFLANGAIGMPTVPAIRYPVLLYPDTPDDHAMGRLPPPAMDVWRLRNPAQLRLVVLDGTWRKSRKQLHLNPALQKLPRLPLQDMPASHYLIRKAHRPDQLSTFEATCHALAQLDGNADKYRALFTAFDGFVAQQSDLARQK